MRLNDVIPYRLQNAFTFPVVHRCDELIRIINEASHKELKDAFPVILESVFGTPGWGLRITDKNTNIYEVDVMLRFLDPMGPLFMLAYKLGTDYFLKYELSLSALPAKLRQELETGSIVSPLYCERLFVDPQTRRPTALLLNPYELLMFRFALHILPRLHPEVWVDSIYTQLTERYLCHFLPCDPQAGPVQPPVPYLAQPHQRSTTNLSPFTQHSTPVKQGQNLTLLKPSVVLSFSSSSPSGSSPASSVQQQSPMMEIWRTVLLTQILVDVWLCVDDDKAALSPAHLRTSLTAANLTMPSSAEHARTVRCLIKHLHYFANSACYTNPTAMDEMKRLVLPSSKLKIYRYLTYTMNHWPLDTSFRVILEAWLSYIQPWRYTNFSNYARQDNEESGRPVDSRWQVFIAEHLPVYTCVFQQLISRFHRIDLACLKNAIMLHRLTKVFSLANLSNLIAEVEESFSARQGGQFSSLSSFSMATSNPLEVQPRLRWQASATQAIAELQGPEFQYKTFFGQDTTTMMRVFVEEVMLATQKALRLASEQQEKKGATGFWSSLFCQTDSALEEYTLEDRRRVVSILRSSIEQICALYQITDITCPEVSTRNSGSFLNQSSAETSAGSNFNLSGLNESTMWTGSPVSVQNEGDPDKMLICTYEVAWLVRMFHDISSYVNREFGLELQVLHERQDLIGRLSRQILQPPRTIYVYERNKDGYKARTEKVLPVRLSLRKLARRQLLLSLAMCCGLAWLLGYHPLLGLIVPALIFVFTTGVHAVM